MKAWAFLNYFEVPELTPQSTSKHWTEIFGFTWQNG